MKKLFENKIVVVGLGYVGLPLCVALGKYFKTIGFDKNPKRIEELKNYLIIQKNFLLKI